MSDATTGETGPASLAGDAEPVFRVVEDRHLRRGIRLERIYWRTLRNIAQATGQKIGALVASIVGEAPEQANVTSLLRVYCLRKTMEDLAAARSLSSPAVVATLVRASPGPAFALGLDKRIVAYNQAFLNYVQARFAYTEQGPIGKDMRLALDAHLVDLAAALKRSGNIPTVVGFFVGVGERRVRGSLSAVLAPVLGQDIVLCYVLP
jgi:predicted DNA-binding ribbon-helix-helix protein